MKPKAYIETTVVSYLASMPSRDLIMAAHQQITHDWWEHRRNSFDLYVSQLVMQEAGAGDEQAAERRLLLVEELPLLQLSQEALVLAKALVAEGALPASASEDALHIAVAAVNGMDYGLTWNLKHLANAVTRTAIVDICQSHNFVPPVLCTPEELMED